MPPRTLTVRGISDNILARLRAQAGANRCSLNGELLANLDAVAAGAPYLSARAPMVRETVVAPDAVDLPSDVSLVELVDPVALGEICRRHQIQWLAVVGSHARGDAHPDSDVDVVVDFAPGKTPGFGLVRVADALRPLFGGRRVNLLTRRGLSPRLRDAILGSARTLHGTA